MPLWLRALLFVIVAPGTVVGLVPWLLLPDDPAARAELREAMPSALRVAGAVLFAATAPLFAWCVADFVRRGRGTPNPYDPPQELVVSGLYRWTRNPMYVVIVAAVLGESAWYGSLLIAGWASLLFLAFHLRVLISEEPALRAAFGESYARYCAEVPRWIGRRGRGGAA